MFPTDNFYPDEQLLELGHQVSYPRPPGRTQSIVSEAANYTEYIYMYTFGILLRISREYMTNVKGWWCWLTIFVPFCKFFAFTGKKYLTRVSHTRPVFY